jgi:predicted AlkP superfamily pyrophosphatase or phosphodiesterase
MTLQRTILLSMVSVLAAIVPASLATAQTATTPAARASAEVAGRHPVLMISIDGLRPDAVLQADRHGLRIPVLRDLLKQGSYAQAVVNVNPTVTNPNHTTLVTGVLPREHGVYNNRPFAASAKLPPSYSLYAQIKAPTLWGAAKAAGLTTASIFWPVTAGAQDIDVNLTDGSSDDDQKIETDAIGLIAEMRPALLTIHFVSLDHEEHRSGPFSAEANATLERLDAIVGRIIAEERKVYPDAVVAVVSDHGFSSLSHQMHLNRALADGGFITLSDGPAPTVTAWTAFAWYVGGSAMIVLHDPQDRQTKARIKAYLQTLAGDPRNGIEGVHTREEIAGLGLAAEAEFVVAFKAGYAMGNAFSGPLVTDAKGGGHGAYSTGMIRPEMRSSFFITGPGIAAGRDLGVIDIRQVAPTLAEKLKVSLPSANMPPLSL